MYRWPWLEEKIRHTPWIGLGMLLGIISLCAWILVSAPGERSQRRGLPMWLIAVVGIVLFGSVCVKYVQVIIRRRRRGRP